MTVQPKFAIMLLGMCLWAQTPVALRGVLTDSSGAVIPGATVRVESASGTKTAVTDGNGAWNLPGLATGEYRLHVEFPGFHSYDTSATVGGHPGPPIPIHLPVEPYTHHMP